MKLPQRCPVWALTLTDGRDEALAVDVIAREEGGERLLVRSAGMTADEAVERALDHLEERLGGSWGMEEWRAG